MSCRICNKYFVRKDSFYRHLKTVHRIADIESLEHFTRSDETEKSDNGSYEESEISNDGSYEETEASRMTGQTRKKQIMRKNQPEQKQMMMRMK